MGDAARVNDWNGTDVPAEFTALPPGCYRVELVEGADSDELTDAERASARGERSPSRKLMPGCVRPSPPPRDERSHRSLRRGARRRWGRRSHTSWSAIPSPRNGCALRSSLRSTRCARTAPRVEGRLVELEPGVDCRRHFVLPVVILYQREPGVLHVLSVRHHAREHGEGRARRAIAGRDRCVARRTADALAGGRTNGGFRPIDSARTGVPADAPRLRIQRRISNHDGGVRRSRDGSAPRGLRALSRPCGARGRGRRCGYFTSPRRCPRSSPARGSRYGL